MKKTVLRYGGFSAIMILVFFVVTWLIFSKPGKEDFGTQEVIGYVGIFLSTLFVFFAIKHFRDHINNRTLSFGQGMKLGSLIMLFPSLAFGLLDVVYVLFISPDFVDSYYNYQVEEMRKTLPPATAALKSKEMESQKELFTNPFFQFIVMFLTVYVIGVIITLISTLILRRQLR